MCCCSTDGANKFFTKHAARYAKRFQKKGLDKTSKLLAGAIGQTPLRSCTILEVGGGVGGLHLTLLKSGARSAFGVEVSEGMTIKSRELAAQMGLSDRVEYVVGDFVSMNGNVPCADIVILDKVVCCYDDVENLINKSLEKARSMYALSYPRDAVLARLMFYFSAWLGTVLKWSFHPFYHDPAMIERVILTNSFSEVYTGRTVIWQVKVYQRQADVRSQTRSGTLMKFNVAVDRASSPVCVP